MADLARKQALSELPVLTVCPHPLRPSVDRELIFVPFIPGETIIAYLARLQIKLNSRDWLLLLNGLHIPCAHWPQTVLKGNDKLLLRAQVAGGGDSGDSNKTLRTIATIAVLAIAQQYEGAARVAIAALGTYAAVRLFPPILPPTDQLRGDNASPTYSITGGSNRARPFEPLPCVLGQHRIFPDYGAQPFTEFAGDDQYFYQVFHCGLTDITLSQFRIGETLLTSYADYDIEESDGTGALTLFPGNVDTAAGGSLTEAAGWVQRTSGLNATAIAVELTGFLYRSGSNGIEQLTVDIESDYRLVGDSIWTPLRYETIAHDSRKPLRWAYRLNVPSGQYEVRMRRASPDETDTRNISQIEWSQLRTYQPDTADYTGQKRVAIRIRANEQLQGQLDQLSATASLTCEAWNGSAWVAQATSNPAWIYRYWVKGKTIGTRRAFGGGLTDADIDLAAIKEWGAWCDLKGLTCNLVFDRDQSVEQQLEIIANCGRAHPSRASGKLGIVWDQDNQLPVAFFGMMNIRRGSFRVNYARARQFDEVAINFINPELNWQADNVRALVPGVTNPVNTLTMDLMGCTDPVMAGKAANLVAAETVYRRRSITWETDIEGLPVTRGDVAGLTHDLTQWGYSGRLKAGSNSQLTLDRKVIFTVGYDHYLRLIYPDGTDDIYLVAYVAGETDAIDLVTLIVKTVWQASAPQNVNDEVRPTVTNGYFYVCDVAGTTDVTEPTWPTTEGDTVIDSGVTWRNAGPAQDYYPDNNPADDPIDYKWFLEPQATPGKLVKITDIKPIDEHFVRITATDEDPNYYLSELNSYTYISTAPNTLVPSILNLEVTDSLINAGNSYAVRVIITWDVSGPYGFAIVRAAPSGNALAIVDRTFDRRSELIWNAIGNLDIEVTAYNKRGQYGAQGVQTRSYTIVGQDRNPDDVTNARVEIDKNGPVLRWDDVNAADLLDYEIREGASWDTATLVGRVDANEFALDWLPAGTHDYLIKARDSSSARRTSTNAAPAGITIAGANPPSVIAVFEGDSLVINYTASAGSQPIAEYEISYGAAAGDTVVARIAANRFSIKANWVGARTWWVTPIDVGGNPGTSGSVGVTVTAPAINVVTRKVIDNQVALSWTSTQGSLPILQYTLYKGDVYASAERIGDKTGTFDLITELAGGTFTYWVEVTDVAGNTSAPVSTVALVNAPPDFVLREDWASTFSGTLTNAFVTQRDTLLVPVHSTETWADHFVNNAWASPQDQIDAGYSYYAIPSLNTAVYEETFDYGTVLEGTLITVIKNMQIITGAVTVTTTISTRQLVTDPWDDNIGVGQIFATNFQYVKIKLEFAASGGDDLAEISQLNVQLSVKQITDEGNAIANASDSGGTAVTFNKTFVAAESIVVTPHANYSITAAIDFPNTPNPTGFSVYLFNSITGARVSETFSWTARGN